MASAAPGKMHVLGVILAGGGSTRFGADKSAVLLGGRSLVDWVVERARAQVESLLLNTNDPGKAKGIAALKCIADNAPGQGPLAGILAGLAEAGRLDFTHLASFACDTPFFPLDTVLRLTSALRSSTADYAVASCGAKAHRIFAIWPTACLPQLRHAFGSGTRSMREIEHWLEPTWADFPEREGPDGDPFFNINTPKDLETARQWLIAQNEAAQY